MARSKNKNRKSLVTFRLPKKVGIIYSDVRREYFPTEAQYLTEKDAESDAKIISGYLNGIGIKTFLYPGDSNLPKKLKEDRPDMIFNLVDSVKGNEYLSSTIPGILELLEIPYTGSGILGLSLDHNKFLVKKLLDETGVPVPNCQLFNTSEDLLDSSLRFPLISKLNEIHGGVEITENAVSETESDLRGRIKYLIKTYDQPVLVEEFIVGKELTALLLEGFNKKVYLAEKIFTKEEQKYTFVTFEDLWASDEYTTFHYQKYEDPLLNVYVKRAFSILRMADYAKFDVRVDSSGRYFFLDANSNPAFGPKETSTALSTILDMSGITFYDILKRLIYNTLRETNQL